MDNYKEYLEERMEGMYTAYNSVILEEYKDKKEKMDKSKMKFAFINYLAFKYEDKNIKYEFKNAKTDEEKEALVKKYSKDFDEWSKRQKGIVKILIADLVGIGLTISGHPGAGMLMSMLCWGGLIKTTINDYKARDNAREEKYLKNKK